MEFSCSSISPEFRTCSLLQVETVEEQWKHSSRALLKVRLTINIRHCLAEWSFSMQLCSWICWLEENRIDSIDHRKSTEHERGNEVMSLCGNTMKTLNMFYCIATQLQFRCSSIIADLSNAEWLKYYSDWSNLFWDVPQSRPWQNRPCTCRPYRTAKAPSRCQLQEVYLYSPTSGENTQVWTRRPGNVAVELWAAGGHCPPGGRFWWAQ